MRISPWEFAAIHIAFLGVNTYGHLRAEVSVSGQGAKASTASTVGQSPGHFWCWSCSPLSLWRGWSSARDGSAVSKSSRRKRTPLKRWADCPLRLVAGLWWLNASD
jgi:hypothetical protein